MKFLVTGAAGFIGSHLVDRLLNLEHKVIAIDDLSLGKREKTENKNLKFEKISICDNLDYIFSKDEIDAVFHLAALPRVQYSIKFPKKTHEANVDGTLNLLDTCRRFDVKKFVFSSSSSVYGDQEKLPLREDMQPNILSPYAMHKLIGELYCNLFTKLYQMECISLRYFNVYGPGQSPEGDYAVLIPKFIKFIKEDQRPKINGDGTQTRDFTYISDVVEANILAANTKNIECYGQAFNIGAGKNYSVNEVTDKILNYYKKDITPIYGPSVIEPKHTRADISKAKELLNWEPKVKFQEGLAETCAYFNKIY